MFDMNSYTGYKFFVMELHDSLFESLAMKKNKSLVVSKIEQIEEQGDIGLLGLTESECAIWGKLLAEVEEFARYYQ